MHQDSVTSVFCLCAWLADQYANDSADKQAFYPEWLASTYLSEDGSGEFGQTWNADQRAHVMGVTFQPREVKWADDPVEWALYGGNPGGNWSTADGHANASPSAPANPYFQYRSWLLLASGLQMAGPHLTPQSFASALQRTTFPNPDTTIKAGFVGFQGNSYTMTLDGAEFYWQEGASSTEPSASGSGSLCYIDHGARHSLGNWPKGGDPFLPAAGPSACDSGAYPGQP